MPPRPRGSASTRARGGGRGAAAAGAATADAGDHAGIGTTEQESTSSIPPEMESQSVAHKQEEADDTNPTIFEQSEASAASAQHSPAPVATMVPTGQDTAGTTSKAPATRIGSLQGSVPPSRSASPSTRGRGSGTRGKRGTIKPSFTGRRSKEDREALEKQQKERDLLRNAERMAADEKKKKEELRAQKREANKLAKARGGYTGAMSGPFSLGSSREDRKNNSNRGMTTFGSGSGSRAVRVKNEDGGGYSGGSGRSGGGGSSIKREDGGYQSSSEEEDDKEFPRKDIDTIEISSDENEDSVAPIQRHRATLPVRIGRKEHQERAFGINTDASTEASAKILEHKDGSSQAPGADATSQTSRKGKGKAKDMEIIGERKPFRGVWQDADEADITVKTESVSDDETMLDAEEIESAGTLDGEAKKQEPPSPDAERKSKPKPKTMIEPILQTDEDRAEWARFQTNLQHIRAELGPEDESPANADGSDNTQAAESTPTIGALKKPSVRDNNAYLFQIPPSIPEPLPPFIKKEPSSPTATTTTKPAPQASSTSNSGPKIKLEEGSFSDPAPLHSDGPQLASGFVGKLRVHQSGKTTLNWGGTSFELTPGQKVSFLQEGGTLNVVNEKERVVPEDAGESISCGRVKGKFVVVPDWAAMLGS